MNDLANKKAHTDSNGMDFQNLNSKQQAGHNVTQTLDNGNQKISVLAQIINRPSSRKKSAKKQFNPNKLPKPTAIYARFGITLKASGWNMAKCPFHDDKHASLSINATHGGYVCHACGAKGNLIGFYMAMTNSDFKTAMTTLGAYDE